MCVRGEWLDGEGILGGDASGRGGEGCGRGLLILGECEGDGEE